MKEINQAYEVLSVKELRKRYDNGDELIDFEELIKQNKRTIRRLEVQRTIIFIRKIMNDDVGRGIFSV